MDRGKIAMQVLGEITDLIQNRIGSGLMPQKVEIEATMDDKDPMKADGMDAEADGPSPDDADLAKLWEGEGMGGTGEDAMDGGKDDDEELMRKMKGM